MTSLRRALAIRLTALLVGLVMAAAACEITVRVMKQDIAFQPDPDLIRSLRPNVTRRVMSYDPPEAIAKREKPDTPVFVGMDYTNNIGLRMKDDVGDKEEGERRILILGDSYADSQDFPFQQRHYHLLNEALKKNNSSNEWWRVVHAGIQNGNPSQYLLMLRRFLPLVQPDLVLLMFSPNDLQDDHAFESQYGYVFDDRGIPLRPRKRTELWLLQKSWSLRYLKVAVRRSLPALHAALFPPYDPDLFIPYWMRFYCTNDSQDQESFRKKTGRYVLELARMSETVGAQFALIMLHTMWLFENEPYDRRWGAEFENRLAKYHCDERDLSRYNSFLGSFFTEHGIRHWNTYSAFSEAKRRDPERKLWAYYDYHFSPAGHELMAQEMEAFVGNIIGR